MRAGFSASHQGGRIEDGGANATYDKSEKSERFPTHLGSSSVAALLPALPVGGEPNNGTEKENLLLQRNCDVKPDWGGYCGTPYVSHSVARTGNSSLVFTGEYESVRSRLFCAPKLEFPSTLLCGREYWLTLWVTTDRAWVRKSRPTTRLGYHFRLTIKANGVQKTRGFKSEEFVIMSCQTVNMATGGRWVKLDGKFQFGYGRESKNQIGKGPSFHLDGIDQVHAVMS